MIVCTQIPVEERCFGCPLTEFEAGRQALQPHEELVVTTNVTLLTNGQNEIVAIEDYVTEMMQMYDRIEKAAWRVSHLIKDIANWRMIDACEHHEGRLIDEDNGQKDGLKRAVIAFNEGDI